MGTYARRSVEDLESVQLALQQDVVPAARRACHARTHVPGWIASRLGIAAQEEQRCLELLERAGQIYRERGRLLVAETRTVDTRGDPTRSRELRAFWARVGTERFAAGADGEFAFNLFGVSGADLERIRQLQRAYFSELRSIVARSEPTEHVVLTNLQLLALS